MKAKLQVVITTIGVAVLMQMSTVAYADPYADQSYSAVASTSGWVFGYGYDSSSKYNADFRALNECHSRGKGQCHIVARLRGEGCVALASGSDGAGGWGWGTVGGYINNRFAAQNNRSAAQNNRSAAQNRALSDCNSRGHGCYITDTGCTEN